jgi:hypothetical protein
MTEWAAHHLIVQVLGDDVDVSGLLHFLRALHAEADLRDLPDGIRLPVLLLHHLAADSGPVYEKIWETDRFE